MTNMCSSFIIKAFYNLGPYKLTGLFLKSVQIFV